MSRPLGVLKMDMPVLIGGRRAFAFAGLLGFYETAVVAGAVGDWALGAGAYL
jgi:hypothetical protein